MKGISLDHSRELKSKITKQSKTYTNLRVTTSHLLRGFSHLAKPFMIAKHIFRSLALEKLLTGKSLETLSLTQDQQMINQKQIYMTIQADIMSSKVQSHIVIIYLREQIGVGQLQNSTHISPRHLVRKDLNMKLRIGRSLTSTEIDLYHSHPIKRRQMITEILALWI